jgi:hypothetical protein
MRPWQSLRERRVNPIPGLPENVGVAYSRRLVGHPRHHGKNAQGSLISID